MSFSPTSLPCVPSPCGGSARSLTSKMINFMRLISRCKPGFFNLQLEDPQGCMSCFCYGHSSVCTTAQGFIKHTIHSRFDSGRCFWTSHGERGFWCCVTFLRGSWAGNSFSAASSKVVGCGQARGQTLGSTVHVFKFISHWRQEIESQEEIDARRCCIVSRNSRCSGYLLQSIVIQIDVMHCPAHCFSDLIHTTPQIVSLLRYFNAASLVIFSVPSVLCGGWNNIIFANDTCGLTLLPLGPGKWKGLDQDGNEVDIEYDAGSISLTAGVNVYQAYFIATGKYAKQKHWSRHFAHNFSWQSLTIKDKKRNKSTESHTVIPDGWQSSERVLDAHWGRQNVFPENVVHHLMDKLLLVYSQVPGGSEIQLQPGLDVHAASRWGAAGQTLRPRRRHRGKRTHDFHAHIFPGEERVNTPCWGCEG